MMEDFITEIDNLLLPGHSTIKASMLPECGLSCALRLLSIHPIYVHTTAIETGYLYTVMDELNERRVMLVEVEGERRVHAGCTHVQFKDFFGLIYSVAGKSIVFAQASDVIDDSKF